MKVKLLSSYTVISTGKGLPCLSGVCVCALNALQNSMILTPCWPKAGPTGGLGFAAPPVICNFTNALTFFLTAIITSLGCKRLFKLPINLKIIIPFPLGQTAIQLALNGQKLKQQ